jgi:hypothetical protein
MSLNESIVEDAGLEWFLLRSAPLNYGGQVGEQCRFAPTLTPALSQGERGKEREAIRRLNPANACGNPHPACPKGRGEGARATIRQFRRVQIERKTKP